MPGTVMIRISSSLVKTGMRELLSNVMSLATIKCFDHN